MSTHRESEAGQRSNVVFMIISAAIFGYFGFAFEFNHIGINGEYLWFVAILEWTLKGSAIAFALTAAISMASPKAGGIAYAIAGLISAVLFVAVAVMDWLDKDHAVGLPPFILLLFAVANGYGSMSELLSLKNRPGASAA